MEFTGLRRRFFLLHLREQCIRVGAVVVVHCWKGLIAAFDAHIINTGLRGLPLVFFVHAVLVQCIERQIEFEHIDKLVSHEDATWSKSVIRD